ncbi:MAG TPA: M14 family zinc carboxypeptidase, partial [Longimicrobiales bacterium]|nr:M14 family zinc carboxypeptidase [Longimicrobiales bacterium]
MNRAASRIAPRPALVFLVALVLHAPAGAQQAPPSPADVLGYGLGERFTDAVSAVAYMEALAAASELVEVRPYGRSVEGRPLVQVLIASPAHRARLDAILGANAELTEPTTTEARARQIISDNPAVVYFSYGVHGNESSSTEAALWTAWDLARGAADVSGVLDSVIVVIDPVVNPDGRDRYVDWYRQARGAVPNPHPEAREHIEPWPGGRFNHYLFDLNRDWAWGTQPETRARLATWPVWNPQVHVDFHEMGWTSSYFFFPATPPINPLYPAHTLEWGERFGAANAAAFDARGWPYYTAESFDLFYPGYGDSWPSLLGGIGMTYEQAGSGRAGLAIVRPDGLVLTLRDRAQHHRVSGEATLRAAAEGKSRLLGGFAGFHRAVDDGLSDILLVPGDDPGRLEALVSLLQGNGIRVERAARSFRAEGRPHEGFPARREFPGGTYVVRARQPRGRLAVTLLQPETVLDASYSYDVSAWSLPFAFGVEAHRAPSVPDAGWSAVAAFPLWFGGLEEPAWDGTAASLARPTFGGEPARGVE